MSISEMPENAVPDGVPHYPITDILKWLLAQHGEAAGLPAWSDPHRISRLVKLSGLSRNTVAGLFSESRERTAPPWQETCERLARLFRPVIPAIKWEWFRATSLEDLKRLVAGSNGGSRTISITVPRGAACPLEGLRRLPGYYVTYRYSIDRSQRRHVAREVIEIAEKDDDLRFRMSFRTGGEGDEDGELMWFEGVVLPVGQSLTFLGWEAARVRNLTFRWDADSPKRPWHLGMLNSTKRGYAYYPIAACTIMIKLQGLPGNEEDYVRAATRLAAFDSMIEEDFGPEALEPISVFLSNSISSVRADGNAREEWVLRINEDRFAARMPDIYREALALGRAPFAPGWAPGGPKARARKRAAAPARK